MKAGQSEFFSQTLRRSEKLLAAIGAALALDRKGRQERAELASCRNTTGAAPREREALPLVVAGLANKQTAAELGASEITIGVYRGQTMRKMGARSLAELVRMADKFRLAPSGTGLNKHNNGAPLSIAVMIESWLEIPSSNAGAAKHIVAASMMIFRVRSR